MEVTYYETEDGKCPFETWLKGINCRREKSRVIQELTKLERGLIGDPKSLGGGLYEKRLDFGNGYRMYYGYEGPVMVVMLMGSTKDDQKRAIKLAQGLWADYKQQKAEKMPEKRSEQL